MRLRFGRYTGPAAFFLTFAVWLSAGSGSGCLSSPPPPPAGCLDNATIELATPAKQQYDYSTTSYTVDARGVDWVGQSDDGADLDGPGKGCWVGGRIEGTWDPADPWELFHGRKGLPNGLGSRPLTVEKLHVLNFGDAVAVEISAPCANGSGSWLLLRDSQLEDIHDDAVESDRLCGAEVDDNLMDRVYTAIAFRNRQSDPNRNGSANTVIVRNNLIRMHAFLNNDAGQLEHNGIWKWARGGKGPKVIVRDNRFLAFDPPPGGTLLPFVNKVVACESNVLLFAGSEAEWQAALLEGCDTLGDDGLCDGERLLALESCYTVVTKPDTQSEADFLAAHWDPYVAAWKSSHEADEE